MNRRILVSLLVILSIFLGFIWFRGGNFLGSGEEGLSLYSPEKTARLYRYAWFETGTGIPIPVYLPRAPLFSAVAVLTRLKLPIFAVQALVFIALFITAELSVFWLVYEFIGQSKKPLVAGFAAIFYLFNPYTLSQVWARFLYSGMFAWAFLPLFLFLWIKCLRPRRLSWFLVFLLSTLIFSNAFGQPAYLFTLWIPAGLFFAIELWRNRKKGEEAARLFFNSLAILALWVLVNLWWIYPCIKVGTSAFSEISAWKTNFDTLRGVSKYFPTSQIILLRQGFLFGKESYLYNFYHRPWVYAINMGVLSIAILGLITSRREKNWPYLAVLAFIGWFVSKGTNPPLGYSFFKFLFFNFPFTAALRNSYEKFGLVWLLPYSIFFALGAGWIYRRLRPKIREIVVGIVLVLSCCVLVWPMWTGDVFAKNVRVEVPDYYKQANDFLNKDKNDGRLLMLPIIPGDGVAYTWGYRGVEPSEFLFDRPAVSKIFRTKYADEKYRELYNAFINDKNYNKFLDEMNIKYLVLHHDLDAKLSNASSSAQAEDTLKKNPKINFIKKIGELSVYEYIENTNASLFITEGEDAPSISYQKLNTTHYTINVQNAKNPYKLIFKETFNHLWKARIDGEKLDEHFLIYNYANGWQIKRCGDYTINIVFKVWPWE